MRLLSIFSDVYFFSQKIYQVFKNGGRKQLSESIEDYNKKLASSTKVNIEETVKCQIAMLVLNTNTEKRVRSLQTLGQLNVRICVPLIIKELSRLTSRWTDKDSVNYSVILLELLQRFKPS